MKKNFQIIGWNFCWHGYNKKKLEYLLSKASSEVCIVLQEIIPEVYNYVEKAYGDRFNFVYSLNYRAPGPFDTNARKLGVLIAFSKEIEVLSGGVAERCLFPDRTVWATAKYKGREIKVLGIHSLTECGYYQAKSIQYDSVVEFMEDFDPDIICIDANEPEVDSYDVEKMEFHENGSGARGFFYTTKRKGLVDAYVKANSITECEAGKCLAVSHSVGGKCEVRYDFVFIRDTMPIHSCNYFYEESLEAESDHALILAELEL